MPPVRQLKKPTEVERVLAVLKGPDHYDDSHWTVGTFKCRCPGCGGKEYPARTYGPWAVFEHTECDNPGSWELIHLKTRLSAVSGMMTAESCFRVGDFLQRRFPLALRLGTVNEIRAKFGDMELIHALNVWSSQCKREKKFVSPTF